MFLTKDCSVFCDSACDREFNVSDALLRLTPGTEQFMNGRPGRQFAQTPPSHEPRVFTHRDLAHRSVRCSKQLTCLASSAISVTSIGQSRLTTASCSACLDIWPHTFEGEFLDCNGRRGPVLQSRQHRVPVIAAASLAVLTELRACGNHCESVPSSKNGEPTLEAQLCCEYFWQF
jgi:hypothetical protein